MLTHLRIVGALVALVLACALPAAALPEQQPKQVVVKVEIIDVKPAATEAFLHVLDRQFKSGQALVVPKEKTQAFLKAVDKARKANEIQMVNAPLVRTPVGQDASVSTASDCHELSIQLKVDSIRGNRHQLSLKMKTICRETKEVLDSYEGFWKLKDQGTFALLLPPVEGNKSRVVLVKVSDVK